MPCRVSSPVPAPVSRLRRARLLAGRTQYEASRVIGRSATYISQVERGIPVDPEEVASLYAHASAPMVAIH